MPQRLTLAPGELLPARSLSSSPDGTRFGVLSEVETEWEGSASVEEVSPEETATKGAEDGWLRSGRAIGHPVAGDV